MDKPSLTLTYGNVSRKEIQSLTKESALEQLRGLYSSDPRPFSQAIANDPQRLEIIYYEILTGEY